VKSLMNLCEPERLRAHRPNPVRAVRSRNCDGADARWDVVRGFDVKRYELHKVTLHHERLDGDMLGCESVQPRSASVPVRPTTCHSAAAQVAVRLHRAAATTKGSERAAAGRQAYQRSESSR